jgi:protein tyrosine phosphatase (PTP) superfamily phosphohydrolase (DUF442 family)
MHILFSKIFIRTPGFILRVCLLLVVVSSPIFIALSHFDALEPYLFPLHYMQGNVRNLSKNIIVGHYPDFELLSKLNANGVKIVISLLNDQLIYEEPLNKKEGTYAKLLGIQRYNFKMDSTQPVTSSTNEAAIENIRNLINNNPNTKVYIHCYLGRHRTRYVEQALFSLPSVAAYSSENKH